MPTYSVQSAKSESGLDGSDNRVLSENKPVASTSSRALLQPPNPGLKPCIRHFVLQKVSLNPKP